MTDKELFEKTEKTFNLKQKTDIVNKVFNEGKFKQTLSEKSRGTSTSPIGSNYGQNTVSAARSLGRGGATAAELAGKGIGATAKGLGKVGGFLRGIIPGTNTNRRKKAETKKREAATKADELKNKQMQQQMMFGGGQSTTGAEPPKANEKPEDKQKREERNKRRRETYAKNKERKQIETDQDHAFKMAAIQKAGNQSTHITADQGSSITTGDVTSTQKQDLSQNATAKVDDRDTNNANLKVGDIIRYKTTKGKESQGTVTNLQDPNKPGNIVIKTKNGRAGSLNKNKIFGKVNESYQYSFEYIVKKYR